MILFRCAVLLLVFSSVSAAADPYWPLRSVCEIRVQHKFSSWTGSGTLVAKRGDVGLVLSCRHVNQTVGENVQTVWHGAGGYESVARVVFVHPPDGESSFDTDIALLVTQVPPSLHPVAVAPFDANSSRWISAGYRERTLRLSVATSAWRRGNRVFSSSPFIEGMSGGATFNSKGQLVGVVVASTSTTGISSDGENLRRALELFGR